MEADGEQPRTRVWRNPTVCGGRLPHRDCFRGFLALFFVFALSYGKNAALDMADSRWVMLAGLFHGQLALKLGYDFTSCRLAFGLQLSGHRL